MTVTDQNAMSACQALHGATATVDLLRRHVERRPYVAVGVAAAVGFVVAGGLAAPALRGVARLAARLALAAATRKLADALVERVERGPTPDVAAGDAAELSADDARTAGAAP